MAGLLALDIDGTCVHGKDAMPKALVQYFSELHAEGWQFIFITGRLFSFVPPALDCLPFPYQVSCQNGASTLQMPEGQVVNDCPLPLPYLQPIEEAVAGRDINAFVCSGPRHQDTCFLKRTELTKPVQEYLAIRKSLGHEVWEEVDKLTDYPHSSATSVKLAGRRADIAAIQATLATQIDVHMPIMRDPYIDGYAVLQITVPEACKGQALRRHLASLAARPYPVIAAGDDANDFSLFEAADVRIAMGNASDELKKEAHIIAGHVKDAGLIQAIKSAISHAHSRTN